MPKYNLLFLFTDEQRADTMAAYGNRRIQTPHLDRLAAQSTIFEQVYVTQPICTPSRSSIMTGLYPHTTGCTENNVPLPGNTPCFNELLDDPDYVAGYHGKWHLGDEIFQQHGFQDWVSIEDNYIKYYSPGRDKNARSSYHHFLLRNGFTPQNGSFFARTEAARLPEQFGKPAFLAAEASRFIRENKGRPFVLFVNFLEPHMPFTGPRDGQYDPDQVELPRDFPYPPTEDQPLKARLNYLRHRERGFGGLPLKTEADWRRLVANYWGLCSLVDTYVGRILETLDACGLRERTIIVYTSDHGDMMGSHQMLTKGVMFEEAMRVPLLVQLPGQNISRRVRGPVSQIDLVPTLLDLLGKRIPPELEGKSLRPLLEQAGDAVHGEDVFVEWHPPVRGLELEGDRLRYEPWMASLGTEEEIMRAQNAWVRTVITPDGWKFSYSSIGEHELYNLAKDPLEIHNLAREQAYLPLMRELAAKIARWQTRTGDDAELAPDRI